MIVKKCVTCNEEKSIENFPPNGGGKRSSKCRPCKQEYDRQYWNKNKGKLNPSKSLNRKERTIRNTKYVLEYLSKNPCSDCGETNPIVLEFDHVKDNKTYNVSYLIQQGSISSIKKEIEKCEVVCSNCHSIRTAKQFNYLMLDMIKDISKRSLGTIG